MAFSSGTLLETLIKDAQRLVSARPNRASSGVVYESKIAHPLRNVFSSMKQRCLNKRDANYKNYGGRGIYVCDRWLAHRIGFRNFIEDMGPRPDGYTLERIDNDGPYSPENCRWATLADQYANRRSNRFLTLNGATLTMRQWSTWIDIPYTTICNRVKKGWPAERILERRVFWGKGKTHCKQGHEFTPHNTYVDSRGSRHCRACGAETMRKLRKAS